MKKLFPFPDISRRRKRRRTQAAAMRHRRLDGTVEAAPPWWLRVSPARAGLGFGTVLLLSLMLSIHLWPSHVSLRVGDVAEREIVAQRTVQYEATEETRRLRQGAAAQVTEKFEPSPDAVGAARDAVGGLFDAVERGAVRVSRERADPDRVAEDIRRSLGTSVPRGELALLLRQKPAVRQKARAAALALVEGALASRFITDQPGDIEAAREELSRSPALKGVAAALRPAAVSVARAALVPNQLLDVEQTRRARDSAAAAVPPQMRRLAAGTVIIRPGERVTRQHIDKFTALGLQNPRPDAGTVAVILVMVFLLVALVAAYLRLFHAELYRDTPRLLLLAILAVVSVVGLRVGSALLGLPWSDVHLGFLGMMCVASAGMAIALLLSPQVATLIVALLSVASGLILNNELRFTVITLGSSLVGIVSVATLRNRGDLVRAMLYLCGANVLLITLVGQLEGDTLREIGTGALWGLISGLFALVLFWLGVAVFEKPFGITTHLRLLELSDPATPILQEFRMRVPGTYAHSLMVGNLAHAAAEAIGADGLLVRVAAYYHDLGKMNRPEFFIENQGNGENIHDRLNPSLSALVLTSHVKEGLEMAEEVGLPPRVRDVIRQHHGTSLMKFFYYRATGGAQDPTLEAQFRYPGPKPQSKEAAILMLADSVEAASRCLEKPTPARITDFVAKMIEDKRADGQLDECDLTLRDLKKVQDVFVRTLSGTLHARIDYPGSATTPKPALASVALSTFPEEALAGALTMVGGGDEAEDADRVNGKGVSSPDGTDGSGGGGVAGGPRADARGGRKAADRGG